MEKLMSAIAAAATDAVAHGEDVEGARRRAGLADFRKQFAGESRLLGFLFDVYVSGPAVDSAFADAKKPAEGGRAAP
jgi:hypothetical protein